MFTANFQRTPKVRTFLRTSIAVVSQLEQTQIVPQQVNTPLPVGKGGVMAKAMARIKARKLARASVVSMSPKSSTQILPVWPVSPLPEIQIPSEPVPVSPIQLPPEPFSNSPPPVVPLPEIQIPSEPVPISPCPKLPKIQCPSELFSISPPPAEPLSKIQIFSEPVPISPPTPLPKIQLPSEPFSISPPPAEPLSKIQLPSEQVPSSPPPTIPTPPAPSLPKMMSHRDSTEPSFKDVEDRIVKNPVIFQEAEKYFEGNKTLVDKIEQTNIHKDIAVNPNKAPITKNSDGKYVCRLCGKTYVQFGSAKRHEIIHTGEKPFACRYCQYKTGYSSNLKKHETYHKIEDIAVNPNKAPITENSNDKYGCLFCGKTFAANSIKLKKHEETHKITNTVPSGPVLISPTTTPTPPAAKLPKIQLSSKPEQSKSEPDVQKMKFWTLPVWPVSPIPKIQLPSDPVPISPTTPLSKIQLPSEPFSISPPPAKPLSKIQLPSEQVSNGSPPPTIPKPPASSLPKMMIHRDSTEPSFKNVEDRIVKNAVSFQEAEKYLEGNKTLVDKIEPTNVYEDIAVNPNKDPITKNSDSKYGRRFCDKTFTQSGSAKRHEIIHTGEKPYACRYCQYQTANWSNFKKHENYHKIIKTVPSEPVPSNLPPPTTPIPSDAPLPEIQLHSEPVPTSTPPHIIPAPTPPATQLPNIQLPFESVPTSPSPPKTPTPSDAPLSEVQLSSELVPIITPPPIIPTPPFEQLTNSQLLFEPVPTSTPPSTILTPQININGSGITQWYPAPNFKSYSVNQNPKDFGKLQKSGLKDVGIMPAKQLKSESGSNMTKIPAGNSSLGNCKSDLIPVKKQRNNLRATKLSYGQKITKLLSEIKKNQDRFKKLPIGPLHMEVKVKENISKEFVEGIETELGKLLLSFLVDNIDDKGVVVSLAKDVDVDITVVVSKYSERLV